MICAHVQAKAEGLGSLCGKETEFVCWHCHAPRCVNHVLCINGEYLCLAAVRAKLGRHSDHVPGGVVALPRAWLCPLDQPGTLSRSQGAGTGL